MAEYPYKISVVMAIYNTVEYLDEAIQSIIDQSLGFENIQMVLVDDGSNDGSDKICDKYGRKFPEQIQVIHQENAGRAAASNAGLTFVSGKYVNFLDSDDKISRETFALVYDFFEKHEKETDIVSIPMVYFGAKEGQHPLNYKYKKGTRIVSLSEEADVIQLHLGSSFVRNEIAAQMHFDTTQVVGIDARECMRILADKLTIGLVAEGTYYYRIRASEKLSILQAGKFKAKRYGYHIERFSLYILNLYREKFGEIPRCVQYAIMYELQSRIRQKEIPEGVLTDEEKELYKERICQVLEQIEDDVIMAQRQLSYSQKIKALSMKYKSEVRLEFSGEDAVIFVADKEVLCVSELAMQINEIVGKGRKIVFSGYMNFVGLKEDDRVDMSLRAGDERYPLVLTDTVVTQTWLGDFNTLKYFKGELPVFATPVRSGQNFWFESVINGTPVRRKLVRFGKTLKNRLDKKKTLKIRHQYDIRMGREGYLKIFLNKKNYWGRLIMKFKR